MRRAFSGIVAGNVKAFGIEQVSIYGSYRLYGDKLIVSEMGKLLSRFVQQARMKIKADDFNPCWELG